MSQNRQFQSVCTSFYIGRLILNSNHGYSLRNDFIVRLLESWSSLLLTWLHLIDTCFRERILLVRILRENRPSAAPPLLTIINNHHLSNFRLIIGYLPSILLLNYYYYNYYYLIIIIYNVYLIISLYFCARSSIIRQRNELFIKIFLKLRKIN